MGAFLFYLLKSGCCLVVFYIFFKLLMSRSTFFRFNRITLLVGLLGCTLLPLIELTTTEETFLHTPLYAIHEILQSTESVILNPEQMEDPILISEKNPEINSLNWIPVTLAFIYGVGALVTLIWLSLSTCRLIQLIRTSEKKQFGNYVLVIPQQPTASFSWGKYIVISAADYSQQSEEILLHETMHLRNHHTLDLLFMQIFLLVYWFNPVVWLLKRELQEVHEFEADNGVINTGIDATKYQLLLVKKAVGTRLYSMACGFNHSKLKNRITMMLKRRTNNWARLKLLLFVPVAAGTLYAFARPEVKKTVGQAINASASVKQNSVQESELQQLEAFFTRKANDAMGGKMESQTEKSTDRFYSFFVNMRNKMMLNQELIKEYDVETLSARLKDLLRKEYRKVANTDKRQVPGLFVRYDRGSSSTAITSYLRTIKEAYLQVRGEISGELGGVSEARLDSLLPIFVSFGEPKIYSSKYKTASDIFLPIEVSLYPKGGTSSVIKNPSLQELELKLKDYRTVANSDGLSVGLKFDKDVTMGIVEDVKEVIRTTLSHK